MASTKVMAAKVVTKAKAVSKWLKKKFSPRRKDPKPTERRTITIGNPTNFRHNGFPFNEHAEHERIAQQAIDDAQDMFVASRDAKKKRHARKYSTKLNKMFNRQSQLPAPADPSQDPGPFEGSAMI